MTNKVICAEKLRTFLTELFRDPPAMPNDFGAWNGAVERMLKELESGRLSPSPAPSLAARLRERGYKEHGSEPNEQIPGLTSVSYPDPASAEGLLPCPFCGSTAEITYRDESVSIRCKRWGAGTCLGASKWTYETADAIKAWNTRPTPTTNTREGM